MSTRREFNLGIIFRKFLSFAFINLHRFVGIQRFYARYSIWRNQFIVLNVATIKSDPTLTTIETKLKMKIAIIILSDPKAGEGWQTRLF
jgi:hypothetical protein